jgi:hypothetical protein
MRSPRAPVPRGRRDEAHGDVLGLVLALAVLVVSVQARRQEEARAARGAQVLVMTLARPTAYDFLSLDAAM